MLTLRTIDGLLSRGIDPALGRSGPNKLTEKLVPNEDVAYRHPRKKKDTVHVNFQEKKVLFHATPQATFTKQRRPSRLSVCSEPQEVIDRWFDTTKCKLGALIPSEKEVDRVKRLLYTYRELNATELSQIPPTDLYKHKVHPREGTKPYSIKFQRRWPPEKEFWLIKIIKEAMACGMYERTINANGKLSDWNADAVLVDKPGQREPRITFN
ncbi:hypothetical protein K3495_g11379 [Podosphaera aphanis]|nr:hypothetical protein K3495_g11379 [Podosphaera aphanis]